MIDPTSITGLLHPQSKTQRAEVHLAHLKAEIDAFRKNPYTVIEHDDVERGLYIFTVRLNDMERIVPLLIGEFAYNLRSALDHLAWQLGMLSGRMPTRSSSFPIHASNSTRDRERFIKQTWDIPCAAVEVIKSLQPHLRGKAMKADPLWQLNRLCNLDKHVTVGYSHTLVKWTVIPAPGMSDAPPVGADIGFNTDDHTSTTRILVPIAMKGKVQLVLQPPVPIFGKPIEAPGADFTLSESQLTEIHRYVKDDVLPKFADFFPFGWSIWPRRERGKLI